MKLVDELVKKRCNNPRCVYLEFSYKDSYERLCREIKMQSGSGNILDTSEYGNGVNRIINMVKSIKKNTLVLRVAYNQLCSVIKQYNLIPRTQSDMDMMSECNDPANNMTIVELLANLIITE